MRLVGLATALLLAVIAITPSANPQTKAAQSKAAQSKAKSTVKRKAPVRRAAPRAPAITTAQRREASSEVLSVLAQEVEPFDNGAALVPFFERVYRLGKDGPPAHILQYGDSHTASDDMAAVLREAMQAKFGNGGPGFSMPGNPYRGYRRKDVSQYYSSQGWFTQGPLFRRGDGLHGLGGVSLTANRPGETLVLKAQGDSAELLFLQQPNGGSFDLFIDGQNRGSYSTEGPLGPATLDLTTIPGERHFLIRTSSPRPVRLLGTVIDNGSGVTWETAGINGAHASIIAEWDDRLLATHLQKRDPALIVLAYGTNEANVPVWDSTQYWANLQKVVGRFRAMAPHASILLVGPPDCRVRSPRALEEVIELQRRMAVESRCSFWDWRGRMGGAGSMRNWVFAGLGQSDYIHFTSPGYERVAHALFEDLMRLYERFVRARMEAADDGKDDGEGS